MYTSVCVVLICVLFLAGLSDGTTTDCSHWTSSNCSKGIREERKLLLQARFVNMCKNDTTDLRDCILAVHEACKKTSVGDDKKFDNWLCDELETGVNLDLASTKCGRFSECPENYASGAHMLNEAHMYGVCKGQTWALLDRCFEELFTNCKKAYISKTGKQTTEYLDVACVDVVIA